MKSTHFIGKFIPDSDIDKPVIAGDMICKLCGESSDKGVSGMITDTFTDAGFFKHPASDLLCCNCAKCLGKITTPEGKKTFFRNFSFLATEKKLKLLKRENILDIILNPPEPPFILCVTFSHKKHMSFKSGIQTDKRKYITTTDIGSIVVDTGKIAEILPIIQSWYSVIPEKADTQAQPTYFTKEDILHGCKNYKKIENYGVEQYMTDDHHLDIYRNTGLLKLSVFCLNKYLKH